jgi:hypothetical protein
LNAEPKRREFADLTTEQLRAMAERTDANTRGRRADWAAWDRAMLLAFFHNRHGRYLPEDLTP